MLVREVEILKQLQQGYEAMQTFDQAKALIASYLAAFITANDYTVSVFPPRTPYRLWWNTVNLFPTMQLQKSGTVVVRNNTLVSVVSEFISSMQVIMSLPVENCTMDNKFVYSVVTNHDQVLSALETNLQLRYQKYSDDYSTFSPTVRILHSGLPRCRRTLFESRSALYFFRLCSGSCHGHRYPLPGDPVCNFPYRSEGIYE